MGKFTQPLLRLATYAEHPDCCSLVAHEGITMKAIPPRFMPLYAHVLTEGLVKDCGDLLSAVCHEQPVSASEVGQHAVSWSGVKFLFWRPRHHLKSGWWRRKPRFWVNLPVCWLQAINIVSGWKLIKPGILQVSASLVILLESPNQLQFSPENGEHSHFNAQDRIWLP